MKIIGKGQIEHYGKCKHCGCEFIYEGFDLMWTYDEPEHYYVLCPKCCEKHWIKGTPELDKLWQAKMDSLKQIDNVNDNH